MATIGQRRKVTINAVAAAANVSRQTVTNVLLHPERVRPDTLERVRAEILRLGYAPSAAAQSMQSQRSGAIGIELNVLGPEYHNALMSPFLATLSVRARERDFHMVTFGSIGHRPTIETYEQMWRSHVVDAFVIADTHRADPRPAWLRDNHVPFAAFGRVWDDPTFEAWVDVDGHHGTSLAVEHCCAAGYERVGYLGWPVGESAVGDDRHAGWLDACGRHVGRAGPAAFVADDLPAAEAAARELIADLTPGDAVVCASDVLGTGAALAARDAGLRLGADLGVVGFDDSELARMQRLTSVAQPLDAIAGRVLDLVGALLAGTSPASGHGTLLSPHLTARASTARTFDLLPTTRDSRSHP